MGEFRQTLKLLNKDEGYDVEYKQSISAVQAEDIVAFANSKSGGTILLGVQEVKDEYGQQRGKVIGCPTGDKDKLSIISKAQNCSPPVEIEVIPEEFDSIRFFRVDIPSGRNKPYCTSGGTYKIRGDGMVHALTPPHLLTIFEDSEANNFVKRFKSATKGLEKDIASVRQNVNKELRDIANSVQEMERNIDMSLGGILTTAENAESLSDDAMCSSDETLGTVMELEKRISAVEDSVDTIDLKLNSLLNHFKIEDPVLTRLKTNVKQYIKRLKEKGYSNKRIMEDVLDTFSHYRKDILENCYAEVLAGIEK